MIGIAIIRRILAGRRYSRLRKTLTNQVVMVN